MSQPPKIAAPIPLLKNDLLFPKGSSQMPLTTKWCRTSKSDGPYQFERSRELSGREFDPPLVRCSPELSFDCESV
jgi:hypothetical protein